MKVNNYGMDILILSNLIIRMIGLSYYKFKSKSVSV